MCQIVLSIRCRVGFICSGDSLNLRAPGKRQEAFLIQDLHKTNGFSAVLKIVFLLDGGAPSAFLMSIESASVYAFAGDAVRCLCRSGWCTVPVGKASCCQKFF
jgi:hypothetical protein